MEKLFEFEIYCSDNFFENPSLCVDFFKKIVKAPNEKYAIRILLRYFKELFSAFYYIRARSSDRDLYFESGNEFNSINISILHCKTINSKEIIKQLFNEIILRESSDNEILGNSLILDYPLLS